MKVLVACEFSGIVRDAFRDRGPERWKNRSRTYQGIADAMAEQWGCLDQNHATHAYVQRVIGDL